MPSERVSRAERRISRTGRRPAQVTERILIADPARSLPTLDAMDSVSIVLLGGAQIVRFGLLAGYDPNFVHCPSETTSTKPSSTLMAVCSSMG